MDRCILFLMVLIFYGCHTARKQSATEIDCIQEKVLYSYDNRSYDSSELVKRTDSNQVFLYFFGTYEDSVSLYINNVEQISWDIKKGPNPITSSDYTGINVGVLFDKTMSEVLLFKLKQNKKCAMVKIDKSYPLCTLHRIGTTWYVGFRKDKLIMK